jgi:dTDP-D-glucose 4,6-dehydratase
MSRALITGGAGFIGSHLSEALLERGWTVGAVDDPSTGSIENVSHLKGHPHFAYTLDSVMNRSLMLELVDRVDVIFHLAAAVAVRLIVERPVYTIETTLRQRSSSWSWPPASTGRATSRSSARTTTSSWGRSPRPGGAMPPRR